MSSPFYPRLADALLTYQGDHTALLDKTWSVASASGRPQLFKYLQSDRLADGSQPSLVEASVSGQRPGLDAS